MPETKKAGPYQLFMLGLCIYVLIALAADTFFTLDKEVSTILAYMDSVICVIFLGDFFYCLFRAKSKLTYMKWGWIDFISSIPMVGPLRWGRAARAFRLLRLLRGVRSTKQLLGFVLERRAQSAITAAAFVSILFLVFSSIAILQVEVGEGTNIKTAEDAVWWSVVTMTTVGYGDKHPVTLEGRLIASVLMIIGIGLFGTFTGWVAYWFLGHGELEQEKELELIRKELTALREALIDGDVA